MCHLPERSTFTLKVRMFDCRTPNACTSWSVAGEVERYEYYCTYTAPDTCEPRKTYRFSFLHLISPFRVLWDHFNPSHCLASTEAGTLHYIDVRKVSCSIKISENLGQIPTFPSGHNSTLDIVSPQRGCHGHLIVAPLPWRCHHRVSG